MYDDLSDTAPRLVPREGMISRFVPQEQILYGPYTKTFID